MGGAGSVGTMAGIEQARHLGHTGPDESFSFTAYAIPVPRCRTSVIIIKCLIFANALVAPGLGRLSEATRSGFDIDGHLHHRVMYFVNRRVEG